MDDRTAVAIAYRSVRRAGALDYPAWCAAVEAYRARHPEVSEQGARLEATKLLADAAKHVCEITCDGVGSKRSKS